MLPQALQALLACCEHAGAAPEVRVRALQALAYWLQLTGAAGMEGAALRDHPLTALAFQGLGATDTFDAAVEAVSELIWCTVRFSSEGMPSIKPEMHPCVQV